MKKAVVGIPVIIVIMLLIGCQQASKQTMDTIPSDDPVTETITTDPNNASESDIYTGGPNDTTGPRDNDPGTLNRRAPDPILDAENKATPQGKKVLTTGRQMTLIDREIIPGGCWNYANEVFNRAGYPNRKRRIVFKSRKKGPYADVSLIEHGDFLYYVNHSYGDIEHSAIFIDWLDYSDKEALMLSYGGERRREPARYIPYDLSNVYYIIRAKP